MGMMMILASCAHKNLKAACSDQNVPSNVTAFAFESKPATTPSHNFGLVDDCGPLEPLNTEN